MVRDLSRVRVIIIIICLVGCFGEGKVSTT